MGVGQIVHEDVQALVLLVEELLSPAVRRNNSQSLNSSKVWFSVSWYLEQNSPDVIGPQGNLQLSEHLSGLLDTSLKLTNTNDAECLTQDVELKFSNQTFLS